MSILKWRIGFREVQVVRVMSRKLETTDLREPRPRRRTGMFLTDET
jgi:hypothetical protein